MKEAIQELSRVMKSRFKADIFKKTTDEYDRKQRKKSSTDEVLARGAIVNALKLAFSYKDGELAEELKKHRTMVVYLRNNHCGWLKTSPLYSEMFEVCVESLSESKPTDPIELTPLLNLIKKIA